MIDWDIPPYGPWPRGDFKMREISLAVDPSSMFPDCSASLGGNMFGKLFDAWRKRSDARHKDDIANRIEQHGWTAIYVGDYHTSPTWAYTIGFQRSVGGPEVIVFDIPQDTANSVFHEIFRQLRAGELVVRDGERWMPEDVVMTWRRVHPSRFVDDPENPWLGLAHDFHLMLGSGGSDFEAYQLVVGDAEGRLPWETGYDETIRSRQRPLWEPTELAPAAAV
jgi:hypothetical protein